MSLEFQSPPESIEGERIFLKARALDQAPELFHLIDSNRAHLRRWMPFEESTKVQADTEKYLQKSIEERTLGTTYSYTIYEKSTNQMIGSIGCHSIRWEHRSCEMGYWISESAQGNGYIGEALCMSPYLMSRPCQCGHAM